MITQDCLLLLGANQGDKESQLSEAILMISNKCGKIVTTSPIFFSESWGYDDALYTNQALWLRTTQTPHELLRSTQSIEKQLGRTSKTTTHYEPRPIDIDIILWEDKIINSPTLSIPHPRMHLRNFVLQPLLCITPDMVHPILGKTVNQLAKICPDDGKVWKK